MRTYAPVPTQKYSPPVDPVVFTCCKCQGHNIKRVKNRTGNGAFQVFDLCLDCGANARGNALYLPHTKVGDLQFIPLFNDYAAKNPSCVVCGKREGTELHHFAPRHIFADAEQWPQAYLCKDHHREWHIRMAAHVIEGECKYCKSLSMKELSHV